MVMSFWVLALCRLVGRCQRFGGTYCLHLQIYSGDAGNWELYIGFEEGNIEEVGQSETSQLRSFSPEDGQSMFETLAYAEESTRRIIHAAVKPSYLTYRTSVWNYSRLFQFHLRYFLKAQHSQMFVSFTHSS
jgi:hypothetical protein